MDQKMSETIGREQILDQFYTQSCDEEFDLWLQYHFSTCERLELQGYSSHLLYIGRKS